MILEILGIIFLIIVCVVAFFAWKLFRFVKKQNNSDIAVALTALPAMEMELEPSNADEWVETERLKFNEGELKKIGASHVGYYCVYQGMAIIKVSMWNFKNKAVALIYEAASEMDKKNVTFIYEVSSKLDNGSICITSNSNAVYESRPEGHKIAFKEAHSILDLFKAIKPTIPEGKKLQKIQDPKSYFIDCYQEIAEWGWRPEQLKNPKTQQVLSSVGITVTDELMDELVEMGKDYSIEVSVNRARSLLAKHTKMSAGQWEKNRDNLIFINEKMQLDHLVEAVYDLAGDLTEAQEKVLKGFEANSEKLVDPISAFQLLLQTLNLRVKKVITLKRPVKTEVYLPL